MKKNNKITPQQCNLIVFKRNALTSGIYILAIILLWCSAYIFLYDTSLYYLYQWFGTFAVSLNFILFSLIFPILAGLKLIEKMQKHREMIIQIDNEMMTISQAGQIQQLKWDDIDYVILFKNNLGIHHLNIATIFPKLQHTFYFQSLFTIKKTEQPQLELLWKSLKKTPPIGLNVNYHCENHAKTLIEILTLQRTDCAHNQYLTKLNKRKFNVLIASFIVLSIVAGLLCWYVWHSQKLSLNHNEKNIEGTNFRSFEQQIYIWKQGQGLFVLPGVKDNDFEGLSLDHLENRAPELYSNVGKTASQVYWQEYPLSQLNPRKTRYLGNDYTKDQQHVYFRNILLPKASASNFEAVLHPEFNTLGYFYGKDQQQVYYKNKPLSPLQPELSQAFSNSFDYIRDYYNVYYHDQRLDKLNAGFTEIFPGNNRFSQGLNLAWDRRGYFYLNENELPNISHGKYFGTDPVDLAELRIVATQSDEPYPGQYHWIFADLHRVYVYDEFYQRLVTLYDFSPQRIQVTGEMALAVHDKTYQLQSTLLRSRSRHGSTSHGFQLSLVNTQTQKTIASYFSRIASSFSPQKTLSQWIHPDSDEEYHPPQKVPIIFGFE